MPKGAQWHLFVLEEDPVEARAIAVLHHVRLQVIQNEWTTAAQREWVKL